MELLVLASGSSGNAVLVSSGETAILVDIGVSALQIRRRLEVFGRHQDEVSAVLISHEHSDHMKGLEVFLKRRSVPVWATPGTWSGLNCRAEAGGELQADTPKRIGTITVTPVRTSHDAREPVAFVLDDGEHRSAICTDTGVFTRLLEQRLRFCHVLLLEANHDPDLLRHGPYPWALKQRIASRLGHLANHQAEAALGELTTPDLKAVVGMHLSAENNSPHLVEEMLTNKLGSAKLSAAVSRTEMLALKIENSRVAIDRRPLPQKK